MSITIKIHGAEGFERELAGAERELSKELRRATARSLPVVRNEVQVRMPRRSGAAATSLRHKAEARRGGIFGRLYSAVFYSLFALAGTKLRQTRDGRNRGRVPNRRILEAAIAASRSRVEAEFDRAVQRVLRRIAS